MKKVIDLSCFNTVTDWQKVKGSVDAITLRLGYRGAHTGTITYDPKYQEYMSACQKLAIPTMIYFFPCSISKKEAEAEAKFIISAAEKADLCGPIWLDSEVVYQDRSGRSDKLSKADRTEYLNVILRKLHAAGFECGVYASKSWFAGNLNDDGLENYCLRWVAQWADRLTYTGHAVALWQYTNSGAIPGINGRVDVSRCYIELGGVQETQAVIAGVTREDIVKQICSWEGWSERNGKFKKIIDIYNYYLPQAVKFGTLNYKVRYSDEWCATAASAAYIQAGAPELFPIECGCPRNIALAKKMGNWQEADSYVPKPADAVLYDWQDSGSGDNQGTPDHIGIVIWVDETVGTFVVMEGNKDEAVGRRTMRIGGRYIRGFICPEFDDPQLKKEEARKEEPMAGKYEISGTGTPSKKVIKTGLLKNGQEVTARRQPIVSGEPCSFSPVKGLAEIDVCDYITTDKKWAYCCVGGKYGYILDSSIRGYLRVGGLPVETVASQVINDDFGKDPVRKIALEALGYDARQVQDKVNEILGAEKRPRGNAVSEIIDVLNGFIAAGDPHQEVIDTLKGFGHALKSSSAWCSETVVAAFLKAGYGDLIGGYAGSAPALKKRAQKLGIWHGGSSGIRAGDIVLYGSGEPNHTEYAIDGTYNISGNYNGTVKKRRRTGRAIHGFIRPDYPEAAEEPDGGRALPLVKLFFPRFWDSDPELYGDAEFFVEYDADGKIRHVILIDTGMNNTDTIKKLKAVGVTRIDIIIISHDHSDHYGFLPKILEVFDVGRVCFPDQDGVRKYQPEYAGRIDRLYKICSQKNIPVSYLKKGDVIDLGAISCKVIFQADASKLPEKENHHFINNMSLYLKFTVNGVWTALLAGDAQNDADRQAIAAGADLQADIGKCKWHGDRGAVSADYARAANSKVVISNYHNSASAGGRKSTYKVYEDAGAVVLKNYEDGDIIITMDGGTMTAEGERSGRKYTFTKQHPCVYKVSLSTKLTPSMVSVGDLAAIEPEDYTADEIKELKEKGCTLLGYLSVGSVSDERSYYKKLEPYALRGLDDWKHERYLDVCQEAVQEWAVKRGKEILARGCDGLWIDNLDVYEEYPSEAAYKGITAILQALYPLGYIMINGGIEYVSAAIKQNARIAHGVTQEEVFTRITDYGGSGKFGTQNAAQSLTYQKYLAKVQSAGMDAFFLEYTRDEGLKDKIIEYCSSSGAGCCISEDVNL